MNIHKGSTVSPGDQGVSSGSRSASIFQLVGSNFTSQISNAGSITNGIDFSSSMQVDNIENGTSGVISGASYTGLGNDILTNSGVIESIDLGSGNDTVTNLSGGEISKDLLTGAGNDTVTNSSKLSGSTNLGSDDDTLEVIAGSVGSVDGGSGTDVLNVTNAVATAYINENCESANSFAVLGVNGCSKEIVIENVESINISSNKTSINGGITSANSLLVNSGSYLHLNAVQNNQFSKVQVNQLNNMGTLYLNSDINGAIDNIGNSVLVLNEKDNKNREVTTFTATITSSGVPSIQSGFYNDNGVKPP
ncbi:hypothetical protein DA717_08180, partial [Piscirickettsiaceae bacterium NZ-RLO2]